MVHLESGHLSGKTSQLCGEQAGAGKRKSVDLSIGFELVWGRLF